MRALADTATVGLVLLDAEQRCVFSNSAAQVILGLGAADLGDRRLHDVVHHTRPDGRPCVVADCPFERSLAMGARTVGEDIFVRPDGTFYPVAFSAGPIFEDGAARGTALEIRDASTQRAASALEATRMRNAAVVADVATALTHGGDLRTMLQRCCESLVRHLDAAFARVWTTDATGSTLELQASAGLYTHIDGAHARVPVGALKIGAIASEKRPHLTNDVLTDPRVGNREWARQEGMVAFAGYPLMLEERVVGVMALFAKHSLDATVTDALASVADAIALGCERLRAQESQRESEERFRNMADNAPVMLWVTDPSGKCTYLNRRWYEFTGQTEETGLGFGWLDAVHPDDAARTGEIFVQANARQEPFRVDYRVRRRDGVYRWAIDSASPRFGLGGEYLGYVGSVIDIADRKAAEDEIRQLNASLEERVSARTALLEHVNADLEAFSYSVSHDLRAPLRHIAGFADLLERRSAAALDDKSREYLALISGAARRGGELVDALLAFSRLGRMDLKTAPVALDSIVGEVRRELTGECEGREVTWKISPLPTIDADATLMRALMRNLMSNALKYTRDEPRPVIEIEALEQPTEVGVVVRDNGVGFDMAHAEKLFGVFQRLHLSAQFEGIGIGLANVKRIAERHGGRVWASAAPGAGATFTVAFPRPNLARGSGDVGAISPGV